jgi:uroporphyrinogen decarboxylase
MTPRERVLCALRREPVDRVPVLEMAIDWKVMHGLGFRRYLDMIEGLDLDAVSVNQMLYVLGWRRFVLPFVRYYTDEWGVRSRLAGEILPVPVGHPLADLSLLDSYRLPDPAKSPLLHAVRHVRRRMPDRAIVMVSRNDFAASWFLCGMEVLLMNYVDSPGLAERLAEMVSGYYTRLFRLAVEAGVDVIFLTDDYAYKSGTLMGRERFSRLILPWLQRGVSAVQEAGGLCVKHTDGNIEDIIDLVIGTGIDGLGPLEPAAGNDLVEIQRQWGDKVALVGNVDVDLLSRGSAAEVSETARTLVRSLSAGGGHILSSGNTITSSVVPENFRAMIDGGRGAALRL